MRLPTVLLVIDQEPISIVIGWPDLEGQRLFGPIHWSLSGKAFPAEDWTDFVGVILPWWVTNLNRIRDEGASDPVTLSFMDGPYELRVRRKPDGRAHVSAVKRSREGDIVVRECDCCLSRLVSSVSEASARLRG